MEMKVKKTSSFGLGCPLLGKEITFPTCQRMGSSVPVVSTEYQSKRDLSEHPARRANWRRKALGDTDLLISRRGVELYLAHRTPASLTGIRCPKGPFFEAWLIHPASHPTGIFLDLGARVRAWYDLQSPGGRGGRKEAEG